MALLRLKGVIFSNRHFQEVRKSQKKHTERGPRQNEQEQRGVCVNVTHHTHLNKSDYHTVLGEGARLQ